MIEEFEKLERDLYVRAKERLKEIERGIKSDCILGIEIENEKEIIQKIIENKKYLERE